MFHVEQSAHGELQKFKFLKICRENGLFLEEFQLESLAHFVDFLLEWNVKVNLISRADTENIWMNHILHSVSPLFSVKIPEGKRVLDLGSGGGLPGVPISIVRPDLRIVHVDSILKKVAALKDIVSRLKLPNEVIAGRAEELSRRAGLSRAFDLVIARAVAPLHDLVKWSRPFLRRESFKEDTRPAGRQEIELTTPSLLAMKGGDLEDEIRNAKLKAGVKEVRIVDLRFEDDPVTGLSGKKLLIVPL